MFADKIKAYLQERCVATNEPPVEYDPATIEFLVQYDTIMPLCYGCYSTTFKVDHMVYAVVFDAEDGSKRFLSSLRHKHLPQIKPVFYGKCGETIYRMPYYDVLSPDQLNGVQRQIFEDLASILSLHPEDFTTKAEYPLSYYFPHLTTEIFEALYLIVKHAPDGVYFDFKWFNVGWQGDTVILLDPFQG